MPFLTVKNLSKSYTISKKVKIDVLRNIELSVQQGEWVALLGASGCGKTTLLNAIGTLEQPDRGSIWCMGKVYEKMSRRELAKFRSKYIGFIFQAYHLIPELNVLKNVLIANDLSPNPDPCILERAEGLLEQVGLAHRLHHHPYELSGGEQQRVAIARALINRPKLLLADEPTGNLDRMNGHAILDLIANFHAQLGEEKPTIIMITHDAEIATRANRIVHLVDGQIVEE